MGRNGRPRQWPIKVVISSFGLEAHLPPRCAQRPSLSCATCQARTSCRLDRGRRRRKRSRDNRRIEGGVNPTAVRGRVGADSGRLRIPARLHRHDGPTAFRHLQRLFRAAGFDRGERQRTDLPQTGTPARASSARGRADERTHGNRHPGASPGPGLRTIALLTSTPVGLRRAFRWHAVIGRLPLEDIALSGRVAG